jgi:hypothetical protein
MQNKEKQQGLGETIFRRIGGRIIPIRVNPQINPSNNMNLVGGAKGKTGQTFTVANKPSGVGSRGPYKTKLDKRNEQRRERYAIRKSLEAERVEKQKFTHNRGIFGNKYLNPEIIGMSLGAGAAAAGAIFGGVKALKTLSKTIHGPQGFSGVTRYVKSMEAIKAYNLKKASSFAKTSSEISKQASLLEKTIKSKDVFDYAKITNMQKEAIKFAQKSNQKSKQASVLIDKINRVKRESGYSYKKPVIDFWKAHEAKFLTGVGLGTAGAVYAANVNDKS